MNDSRFIYNEDGFKVKVASHLIEHIKKVNGKDVYLFRCNLAECPSEKTMETLREYVSKSSRELDDYKDKITFFYEAEVSRDFNGNWKFDPWDLYATIKDYPENVYFDLWDVTPVAFPRKSLKELFIDEMNIIDSQSKSVGIENIINEKNRKNR